MFASFDPIHLGHLDVIERAAGLFATLVVAAVSNPDKSAGMLSMPERETYSCSDGPSPERPRPLALRPYHRPRPRSGASALVRVCGKEAHSRARYGGHEPKCRRVPDGPSTENRAVLPDLSSAVQTACRDGDRAGLIGLVPAVVIEFLETTGGVTGGESSGGRRAASSTHRGWRGAKPPGGTGHKLNGTPANPYLGTGRIVGSTLSAWAFENQLGMNYYLPLVLRHVFTKVSLMCLTGKAPLGRASCCPACRPRPARAGRSPTFPSGG